MRRDGRSHAHPLVVLVACRQPQLAPQAAPNRYGFVAGRAVGNAVQRNRAKRRLRECVRALLPPAAAATGWDVILIARAPAATTPWAQLQATVAQLLQRAQVLPRAMPLPQPVKPG